MKLGKRIDEVLRMLCYRPFNFAGIRLNAEVNPFVWKLVTLSLFVAISNATVAAQTTRPDQTQGASESSSSGKPREAENGAESPPRGSANPFANRVRAPEFPAGMEWLNSAGPLRLSDLRGKFVILDFWTYCCINCMHVLPELKKLEQNYPRQLVVVGVHSAKFSAEKASQNIREAILRYEIEHPVVNDFQHVIWNQFGVRSWPTIYLIDPEGYAVFARGGEFQAEEIDDLLQRAIPHYRQAGTLNESPTQFDLLADKETVTPLRFPGKVLADEEKGRLVIADSNHNRIVVTSLSGQLQQIIGSGRIGQADGAFDSAEFNHPQGMAVAGDRLWVADTENHLIREIDLQQKQVRTIAGIGQQGRVAWPGADQLSRGDKPPERWIGKPLETAINSPWALWADGSWLYVAMAGPHQIWRLALDGGEIGPYAGNGREDIVDGPLLPRTPYELGYSSFAQPSGLASDGEWLYVADSEGSSIRAVPLDASKKVRTVVGTANLSDGRLFEFGDVDGTFARARLQHVLGVTYHGNKLYVADTYNSKVKEIDLVRRRVSTLAGTSKPGSSDQPAQFDEPAGITYAQGKLFVADTNNHAIRVVDLESRQVSTLQITGLTPP